MKLTGKQLFDCLKASEVGWAQSSYDDKVEPHEETGMRWNAILDGAYDLDLAADLIIRALQESGSSPPRPDHPATPSAQP